MISYYIPKSHLFVHKSIAKQPVPFQLIRFSCDSSSLNTPSTILSHESQSLQSYSTIATSSLFHLSLSAPPCTHCFLCPCVFLPTPCHMVYNQKITYISRELGIWYGNFWLKWMVWRIGRGLIHTTNGDELGRKWKLWEKLCIVYSWRSSEGISANHIALFISISVLQVVYISPTISTHVHKLHPISYNTKCFHQKDLALQTPKNFYLSRSTKEKKYRWTKGVYDRNTQPLQADQNAPVSSNPATICWYTEKRPCSKIEWKEKRKLCGFVVAVLDLAGRVFSLSSIWRKWQFPGNASCTLCSLVC